MKIGTMFAGLMLLLAACDRSKSYYAGHEAARATTTSKCADGRARGRDCDNAAAAVAQQRHRDAEKAFRSGLDKP